MQLKVSDVARDVWDEIVRYYLSHYGTQAILNLTNNFEQKANRILSFPESGTLEQFANGKTTVYRSFHISAHLKVLYFVDYDDDSVKIADIWDTRMNPSKLKRRLKKSQNY